MRRDERYHLITSLRCNNRCLFCMEGDHAGEDLERQRAAVRSDFLTPERLARYLDHMKDKEIPVLFASGEPTLNPHLLELVAIVHSRGYREVAVQTNGRMLSYRSFLLGLVEKGVTGFHVSVHGSRREVHDDATRIAGSFVQTMAGIRNILRLKEQRDLKLVVAATLTKMNIGDMGDMLRLLLGFRGIDTVVLNPLILDGKAVRNAELVLPAYSAVAAQFRRAVARLRSAKTAGLKKVTLIDMPPCLLRGLEEFGGPFESVLLVDHQSPGERQGSKICFAGVKRAACRSCRRFASCTGIYPFYIRKFGWEEFVPLP